MSAEELHLDELLGAYALDAVEPDERRAVEEYLAVNPRARQEVLEHREVATLLAWTGMAAPEGLWDRISAELEGTPPRPSGELAAVLTASPRARRRWRTAGTAMAAAAAAALVAVVATVALVDDDPVDPLVAAVAQARVDRDSTTAVLMREDGLVGAEAVVDGHGQGYLLGNTLPQLPPQQTYQLWGVIEGQVISLGVLGRNPEIELFAARAPVTTLVVTIEEAGGVVADGNPEGAFAGELS